MASQSLVIGVPAAVLSLQQEGLLERAFHDGLYPAMLYRGEAQFEEWDANTGSEIFMSRPGLLAPSVKPLIGDPSPKVLSYEQWSARLERYGDTIDTHIPTSTVANGNLFLRNINQLGLQAGQSVNRLPRNALFQAYLSGQTVTIASGASGDTSIRVASLNGFTDVIVRGTNVRPALVSVSTPLPVTIAGVTGSRNVIGYNADNPDDLNGPGTLYLDASLGASVAARAAVVSAAAPRVLRAGGGASVDALSSSDTLTMSSLIQAVNILRKNNVPPHEDGTYHVHFPTDGNSQILGDDAFQRLNTSLPDHTYYRDAFVGAFAGCTGYLNTEAPDYSNSGDRTSTGTNAYYSQEIGAETTNESGINVGRTIVTGRGCIYERGLDESQYVTEAGITGKVGEFSVINNGIEVQTERVRLILRAPLNRLQDVVAATWSITTSFPVPSDITSGGAQRFKRAVVIEHALDG